MNTADEDTRQLLASTMVQAIIKWLNKPTKLAIEGLGGAMVVYDIENGIVMTITVSCATSEQNLGILHDVLKYKDALDKIVTDSTDPVKVALDALAE